MNTDTNRKASRNLTHGDYFTYRGERAKFLHFTGYPYSTRYGTYQRAWVLTPDGSTVQWALNMAGSVEV